MGTSGDRETSDAQLIERSLVDAEVFAAIFERHAESIHRFLWRRSSGPAVDDLVSDVFLTAFRRRSAYDVTRADARPWLFGIAVNVLRHSHRSEVRRLDRDDRAHRAWIVGPGDDASVTALAGVESARIRVALDALEDRQRDVLLLLAGPEFSYEEVAQALEIPIGTVRSRASRGRDRLRELLALDGPAGGHDQRPPVPLTEGVAE